MELKIYSRIKDFECCKLVSCFIVKNLNKLDFVNPVWHYSYF